MSQKFYAIKCTNCAAPLDVLGGGRVRTITCEYCHSTLDMNDHYKVLSTFNDVKRPDAPFGIGMRGNIKGVEWTIIGWITYKTAEFPSEEWSEFFLYSPTHGYAWLVYEEGVVSFSMRVRDFDIRQWQTHQPKTVFYHKGHYVDYEGAYPFYVDYVEGELSWVAKFGDQFNCWDYKGVKQQTLSIEKNGEELEVYHTQKLNQKEIYSAFSLEYTAKTKTTKEASDKAVSIDNDITIEERDDPVSKNGFMLLFVILALLAFASLFYSKTVHTHSYSTNYETQFNIHSSAFLTSIKLSVTGTGDAGNKLWLYKEGEKIFYIDKNKVFFTKKELGHSWKANAVSATIYLKLDKGLYRLVAQKNANQSVTTLTIKQQVIRTKYLIPLLVLLAFLFVLSYAHLFHEKMTMILFIIIPIIVIYQIFGSKALFGLAILFFYIYNSYTDFINKEES